MRVNVRELVNTTFQKLTFSIENNEANGTSDFVDVRCDMLVGTLWDNLHLWATISEEKKIQNTFGYNPTGEEDSEIANHFGVDLNKSLEDNGFSPNVDETT